MYHPKSKNVAWVKVFDILFRTSENPYSLTHLYMYFSMGSILHPFQDCGAI
jgi:hypothetical protein